MNHSRALVVAVLALAVGGVAFASDHSLSGEYQIGGKTLIDPPATEAKDTHFRVFLTGPAAQDLYQAMKVRAVEDECLRDGSVTKFLGGTACTKLAKGGAYECSLSINVKAQRVESAYAC